MLIKYSTLVCQTTKLRLQTCIKIPKAITPQKKYKIVYTKTNTSRVKWLASHKVHNLK